jgi:hypothetical protein
LPPFQLQFLRQHKFLQFLTIKGTGIDLNSKRWQRETMVGKTLWIQ